MRVDVLCCRLVNDGGGVDRRLACTGRMWCVCVRQLLRSSDRLEDGVGHIRRKLVRWKMMAGVEWSVVVGICV